MLWTVKFVEPVPARQDICPVSCRRGWDAPCEDRLIALSLDVCVQRRGHGGLRRPPLALYVLPLQRQPANTGIRLMNILPVQPHHRSRVIARPPGSCCTCSSVLWTTRRPSLSQGIPTRVPLPLAGTGCKLCRAMLGEGRCRVVDGCERAFRWMAYLVISAVVRSLRSCLSTVTAADLKMPPPPFSMSTPCPNAVLGSPEFSCRARMQIGL